MDQRTDDWLNWRNRGLGASDAPIIMGVSPWKTPRQLWEQKTGKVPLVQEQNYAQERGNRLEPIARAKYELETGFEMGAATCAHYQLEWLRASMDGFNPKCPPFGSQKAIHKRGLEIKCPGQADHEMAKSGSVPEKYIWQLVQQFIVTGADVIDYYSYFLTKEQYHENRWSEGHGVRIEVFPDVKMMKKYVKAAEKFWGHVQDDTPPPLTADDYKLIRSRAVKDLVPAWKEQDELVSKLKEQLKAAEQALDVAKDAIITAIGEGVTLAKIENTGVVFETSTRKGNVDYSTIPELKGVNLEPYRKKTIVIKTLSIEDPADSNSNPPGGADGPPGLPVQS